MKTIDVSKNVMGKVVHLERGRIKRWIIKFVLIISALLVSFMALGFLVFQIISERQGWDLLTLFGQDPEIIAAYWRDTLWIFWEVAPQQTILSAIVLLILIICALLITRRRRIIIKKKLHQLEKYQPG